MKRTTFAVAAIAFAATAATVGTAVASFMPPLAVQVWVRRVEITPPTATTLNISAGVQNITPVAVGTDVTVSVNDTTTPGSGDTRKGRTTQLNNDNIIQVNSAVTTLPLTPTSPITVP